MAAAPNDRPHSARSRSINMLSRSLSVSFAAPSPAFVAQSSLDERPSDFVAGADTADQASTQSRCHLWYKPRRYGGLSIADTHDDRHRAGVDIRFAVESLRSNLAKISNGQS